jgi:hypothetical protein
MILEAEAELGCMSWAVARPGADARAALARVLGLAGGYRGERGRRVRTSRYGQYCPQGPHQYPQPQYGGGGVA